jgi:hypothetical protein
MDNSVQGLDQGLYHMKRFNDRWLKYSSMQSCQRETEITLFGMGINTILWKEPSWIYDKCHIMLLEHHGGGHPWFLPEDFKTKKIWCRCRIWLDCVQQLVGVKLGVLWGEPDQEINTRAVDHFLIFPMVICTPWYDKQCRSYAILKSIGQLEFLGEQSWEIWETWTFDPKPNGISENFQWCYCR